MLNGFNLCFAGVRVRGEGIVEAPPTIPTSIVGMSGSDCRRPDHEMTQEFGVTPTSKKRVSTRAFYPIFLYFYM